MRSSPLDFVCRLNEVRGAHVNECGLAEFRVSDVEGMMFKVGGRVLQRQKSEGVGGCSREVEGINEGYKKEYSRVMSGGGLTPCASPNVQNEQARGRANSRNGRGSELMGLRRGGKERCGRGGLACIACVKTRPRLQVSSERVENRGRGDLEESREVAVVHCRVEDSAMTDGRMIRASQTRDDSEPLVASWNN